MAVQDRQHWPKAIVGYAADYPRGHTTGRHCHERDQLVHGESGLLTMRADHGAWVVPPGYAVWVPAGVVHEVRAATVAAFRTLYLREDAGVLVGSRCRVVRVPSLVRELIGRVCQLSADYPITGPEARLVAVLTDELATLPPAPLDLPMPGDRRAAGVADALLATPADNRDLAAWGRLVGASARTLARLFQRDCGMSFGHWRQRRRLLAALERLAAGEAVTTVALDLGYASPSAFIVMFRRALGVAPTRYLGEMGGP
ncbi:MAG: helix-turn-helix transcriptional regulator [Alphaproteobacteria bacterium]|nr:helix-turn-helix transcriptional regulator [Alphaproteobacteria bacterium]